MKMMICPGQRFKDFFKWCDEHHLILNVNKTGEMVFDPKSVGDHLPVVVHNTNIDRLFIYLTI